MLGVSLILAATVGATGLPNYPEAKRSGETLLLEAGATAKVTLRVPITGPPTQYAQVLVRSTGWTGLADVLPMGDIARVVRKPSAIDVVVLVSANMPASRARPGALRVVVNDPNIGRTVGEIVWRPRLKVTPRSSAVRIDEVAEALRRAQSDLNVALSGTGPAADTIRSTGMVMLRPDTAQWREAIEPVIGIQGRIQALAAQLRSVGLAGAGGQADAAVRALAANRGWARKPSSRTIDRVGTTRGLKRAAALLERLQFEETIGWLDALVDSRRLRRAELAQALVLRGTTLALGGFDEEARRAFGEASCLDPVARPPARPVFDEAFSRLAQPPACAQPLNTLGASATRSASDDAIVVTVNIAYGPDPFGLITGGVVQLFNPSGVMLAQQPGTPEQVDDQAVLVAEFVDDGTLSDPAGAIYVAASLDGPSRVPIAELGVPEAEPVDVEETSTFGSDGGLPWWAWAAIGVAAVGGATAAIFAATSSGDDTDAQRGIGPIDIRF